MPKEEYVVSNFQRRATRNWVCSSLIRGSDGAESSPWMGYLNMPLETGPLGISPRQQAGDVGRSLSHTLECIGLIKGLDGC